MNKLTKQDASAASRCDAQSVQELYQQDADGTPQVLLEENYKYAGSEDIPVARYISADFAQLEYEHMWKKVWQVVGREEQIPKVGDYLIYDIGDLSLIIVRSAPDTISALHNFCVHRGRKLKEHSGKAESFRCPFHAWEYGLDGRNRRVPCKWDFAHMTEDDFSLRVAKVDTWGGFIFVNFDADCLSLKEYFGDLWHHFDAYPLEDTYTYCHVRRKIPCNWKVGVEAFSEGYHTIATHPQLLPFLADANSQYDNYHRQNFNRMLNPQGVNSPHLGSLEEKQIADAMLGAMMGEDAPQMPEGESARNFVADTIRKAATHVTGVDHSHRSNAEMLDVIQYTVFPNFFPWGGTGINTLAYVFRPDGHNPDSAILDIYWLRRFDKSKPRPAASAVQLLEPSQSWAEAQNFGIGYIFDQDETNMELVQKGMKASQATKSAISLANYQECRIRDLHINLDRYIDEGTRQNK